MSEYMQGLSRPCIYVTWEDSDEPAECRCSHIPDMEEDEDSDQAARHLDPLDSCACPSI